VDPFSALIFAVIVTHVIMKAAGQAAVSQARTETQRARDAIRRDLEARRSVAAQRLRTRLDAGRATGPRAGWWWAWAGLRTAAALRRAYRQRRRPAEQRQRPLRGTTGPLGRIIGAAFRGALYAWTDIQRQRRDAGRGQRPDVPETGVCERCGAVVAAAALAEGLTRLGRKARMCAQCRALSDAERQADAQAPAGAPGAAPGDVVDAEVVQPDPYAAPGSTGTPSGNLDDRCGWCGAPSGTACLPVCWCAACQIRKGPPPFHTQPWGDDPDRLAAAIPALACVRCGSPLVAMACSNPECPLCPDSLDARRAYRQRGQVPPAEAEAPGRFRLPYRPCSECGTQLVPSTWYAVNATNADVCLFCAQGNYPEGACRERQEVELAAIGEPVDDQGRPMAWTAGMFSAFAALGEDAARIATEAARSGQDPTDSPPDDPAGPQALPAPATPTEGDEMSCQNGELHTQADWASQSGAIQGALGEVTTSAENMLRCLDAKNAGRGHMTAAKNWADEVASVMTLGGDVITSVNDRQDPYVNAVQGAGGSDEVADPDYYDEM
jgi:hypothetical protein